MDKPIRILKKLKITILLFIVLSCQSSKKKLHFDIVNYSSLPTSVKSIFIGNSKINNNDYIILSDSNNEYLLDEIKRGSFTDHYILNDLTNQVIYRIDYGVSLPLVIYKDKFIYSSIKFNIINTERAVKSDYKKFTIEN